MRLEVYPTAKAAGEAAAASVAEALRELGARRDSVGVIFATGSSQFEMLLALTSTAGLPWAKVHGFHLDEYIGLDRDHPGSFRRYLRDRLTSRVRMGAFAEIDGNAANVDEICLEYSERPRAADPQICLLGIGENGHLAFNEPHEADFADPKPMKVVTLDAACREQQLAEGWFGSLEEVPRQALTLTIPTLLQVPELILSVPGKRKAAIVRRALYDPISTHCPASILRTHPNATMYLDEDSAAELERGETP